MTPGLDLILVAMFDIKMATVRVKHLGSVYRIERNHPFIAAILALAEAAGLRGLHAGALANSAAAEALTSVLIFLNKTYSVDGAGLRITGKLLAPAD